MTDGRAVRLVGKMTINDRVAKVVGPEEVARRLKLDYSRGVKDQTEKILEELTEAFTHIDRADIPLKSILTQFADIISKRLGIATVGIALRDPSDRMYRYETVVGVSEQVLAVYKKFSYTREQVTDESVYKSYEISKHSRMFLGEDHPYAAGEESSYQRPGLLDMKRRSVTDSLEADYIDTFFYDSEGEMLGWIEISGTRTKRIPDSTSVKWTELVGLMISTAVRLRHPGQF